MNLKDCWHVGVLAAALESGNVPDELRTASLRYAREQGDKESLQRFLNVEPFRGAVVYETRRKSPWPVKKRIEQRSPSLSEPPGFERPE